MTQLRNQVLFHQESSQTKHPDYTGVVHQFA